MVRLKPKKPDGAIIEIWQTPGLKWAAWNFAITYKGIRRRFPTIPNRTDTKHAAICRARLRAKWLDDGTWDKHYKTSDGINRPVNTYNEAMKRMEQMNITDGIELLFRGCKIIEMRNHLEVISGQEYAIVNGQIAPIINGGIDVTNISNCWDCNRCGNTACLDLEKLRAYLKG